MKKTIILIIFCLFIVKAGNAHIIIKGKVVDAISKLPLVGVNVIIQGTNCGTITNELGNFTLKTEDTLIVILISFIK